MSEHRKAIALWVLAVAVITHLVVYVVETRFWYQAQMQDLPFIVIRVDRWTGAVSLYHHDEGVWKEWITGPRDSN